MPEYMNNKFTSGTIGKGIALTARARRSGLFILIVFTAIISVIVIRSGNRFNPALLDTARIQKHIVELTSSEYAGRLTGSAGNEAAVTYVKDEFARLGLDPAGTEQRDYLQPFRVVVPDIDPDPVFRIAAPEAPVKEFTMYEDYNLLPAMNGSGIDFRGDIIIAGNNLTRLDPALLQDRIVVIESLSLTMERVLYVLEHGGRGILCSADSATFGQPGLYESVKVVNHAGTMHPALAVGYISRNTYRYLHGQMDEVLGTIKGNTVGLLHNVEMKAEIEFPVRTTANVIGSLTGQGNQDDGVLLISANLDGTGEGTGGRYFPGALSSASGVATLLEITRVVTEEAKAGHLPYRQIVFALWNGQLQQLSGTEYFIGHPTVPLEKMTVLHLGALGVDTLEGVKIGSDSIISDLMKDTIQQFGVDAGLKVRAIGPVYGPVTRFNDLKIAGVTIADELMARNGYGDTADTIHSGALENSASTVLYYLKRAVYRDTRIDYLGSVDWVVIGVLVTGLLIIVLMQWLYRSSPGWHPRRHGAAMEDIYFRTPAVLLRRTYGLLGRIGIALSLLVLIANIDPGFNVKQINGERMGNLSWYLVLKQSLLYLRGLFSLQPGVDTSVGGENSLFALIYTTSFRTLRLLGAAIAAATVLGIAGGMLEGYRTKSRSLRSLGSLVIFSVPDVLIVLLGLLLYVVIAQQAPGLNDMLPWRDFLLPLVTLAIIPTIYISRITFITTQEELRKD